MMRSAFSLVEMLIVILIVGFTAAIILSTPKADEREASVRAAADELAAVLRANRAMAIERRVMYAVSFNVQNPPGSNGRVLRNSNGGHWYRTIGPRDELNANLNPPGVGCPPIYSRTASPLNGSSINLASADSPVRYFISAVDRAWVGDRHSLPAGKVRFVALADQDNGDYWENGDTYSATYPRPWFGWWDSASKRLYPWGGYDPSLSMTTQTGPNGILNKPRSRAGRTISHSGFYYEGYDGAIAGCTNPSDRNIYDDTNGDGVINNSETSRFPLWRAGDSRPLINARWGDCMIIFRPDGTAVASWMSLRHNCASNYSTSANLFYDPSLDGTSLLLPADMPAGRRHMMELGPGDMCNRRSPAIGAAAEATWMVNRSGYYFITLGPDLANDNDSYADAQAVVSALMPLYRVGVSPYGDVKVLRVRARLHKNDPGYPDQVLDTALTGNNWNVKAVTDLYYRDHVLVNQVTVPMTYYTSRGYPVTDVVTAEMLRDRKWWLQ